MVVNKNATTKTTITVSKILLVLCFLGVAPLQAGRGGDSFAGGFVGGTMGGLLSGAMVNAGSRSSGSGSEAKADAALQAVNRLESAIKIDLQNLSNQINNLANQLREAERKIYKLEAKLKE
ncbi:MAG: hypothetical protein H6679_00200 [Epsilonproteobacteria bacterium]|nr:hypothetical protein [Campylobacterota bacterium]